MTSSSATMAASKVMAEHNATLSVPKDGFATAAKGNTGGLIATLSNPNIVTAAVPGGSASKPGPAPQNIIARTRKQSVIVQQIAP